jgi:hypothetical protein
MSESGTLVSAGLVITPKGYKSNFTHEPQTPLAKLGELGQG